MASDTTDNFKLLVGFPVFFVNLLALYLLVKSTKLDFKIRTLSINLCVADCLTCVALCFPSAAYRRIFGTGLKDFFVLLPATVSFLTITLFNLDRFLALKATMSYYKMISIEKLRLSCLLTWFSSLVITYSQYCSVTQGYVCKAVLPAVRRNTLVTGYVRLLLFLINVLFFGSSLYHIKYKVKGVSDRYKCMNQTRTFLKISAITGTFLVLFTPGMLWTIIKPHVTNQTLSTIVDIVCGLCFSASFIMDPIWYVLRFSDCQFQLKLLRYICRRHKREEIEALRRSHYATYHIHGTGSLFATESSDLSKAKPLGHPADVKE